MFIDDLLLNFMNTLCVYFGKVLTPIFRIISLLGEKAWFFLLIALILVLNKKTRWIGAVIILSVFMGWILADFCLKPLIMRLRPYTANNIYQDFWNLAGAYPDTNYSMPSGHMIAVSAFFISLYITCKKKYRQKVLLWGIISIVLMALSRMYFMHHYFTDCVVGVIIAFITSFISKAIIKSIYGFCKSHEDKPIFKFIIDFDIMDLINNE